MTYEMFLDCLECAVQQAKRENEQIKRVHILKNNGVYMDGFACRLPGRREEPTVYVNHYYRENAEEEYVQEVAHMILGIQRESMSFSSNDLEQVLDFERMKKRIFFRLVSKEKNAELLKKVPYVEWQDLALIFYLKIPEVIVKHATAVIHTNHMERWGVGVEELYHTAKVNMEEMPLFLHPIEDFLKDYGLEDFGSGMHVLSNQQKEFGAAVIVDPKVQKMCADRMKGDYYVLPSSIHEVILLPARQEYERKELDEMIRDVNGQCVSREEYLGNHAYYYSVALGKLEF